MRQILLFFVLWISCLTYSQNQELYFVRENDSVLSVRDGENCLVISPFVVNRDIFYKKERIKTDIIFVEKQFINYDVYNRKGTFLFKPAIVDYSVIISEGHFVFLKDGKQGLANKEGQIKIPAEYDKMSVPVNGLVSACKGCYFDREKDIEHPPLVGGVWFLLDKDGNILNSELKEYSYNRNYNKEELTILDKINNYKKDIAIKLGYNTEETKFEIVYRPTLWDPYYHIKIYYKQGEFWATEYDDISFANFIYDPQKEKLYGFLEKEKVRKLNGEKYYERILKKKDIKIWIKTHFN